MLKGNYTNFVRASSFEDVKDVSEETNCRSMTSGEEARRLYLDEVKNAPESRQGLINKYTSPQRTGSIKPIDFQVSNKDLFLIVQSGDVDKLKLVLNTYPDKINTIDNYGWSLLMIACQANSIDTVKELLERGVDITIRDKAGNSAQSLVIKNKNYILADVFSNHGHIVKKEQNEYTDDSRKELFFCELCNKTFHDNKEHLSSTLHNINVSRKKKIQTSYVIPQSNRGYQMMLKVGWDKDSGLGRDGTGKKYPIKVVKKDDRYGLGHLKRKHKDHIEDDSMKHKNRKQLINEYHTNRKLEINFRRQFY